MEFQRHHNKTHLFKYASPDTAKLVLEHSKLKCDCPLNFNDPFDVQVGLHYDFDLKDLPERCFAKVETLVEAEEEPIFNDENEFSQAEKYMRAMKKAHGFPKEKIRQLLNPTLTRFGTLSESARLDYVKERRDLVKKMRMLCLSENYESVLMWSHYAAYHKGVVFKLKVAETEAEDDPFWLAEQVQYMSSPIPLMTIEKALDFILGVKIYDVSNLTKQLVTSKFDVWEYEKEWRIWTLNDEGDDSDFFIKFKPSKVAAIYFGCRCKDDDIADIMTLARSKNRDTEFYRGSKHEFDFRLKFEKLT